MIQTFRNSYVNSDTNFVTKYKIWNLYQNKTSQGYRILQP